jgi:putative flippase GtrA
MKLYHLKINNLVNHLWQKLNINQQQKLLFLIVGGYNTVFGYLLFCLLQIFLQNHFHYLIILTISHFLSVINSFISFKIFVFKTKHNWLFEYCKVNLVYLFYLLNNFWLLWFFINIFHCNKFFAQLLCIILLTIAVYFLHKNFVYKKTTNLN